MDKNLPILKFVIREDDPNSGVEFVALVDDPAIKLNWQAFKEHKQQFQVVSEDKQIISGALMVADMPIYRKGNTPELPEYYCVFDSPTINQIVKKFFKEKRSSSVNLMHEPDMKVNDVYMYESFIIDTERGINPPKGFEGLANGSWFGTFKVDNPTVWEQVKNGTFKGFSVEGFFETDKSKESKMMNEIIQILELIEH
jgi:Putative phage serine protease XkdF